MSPNDADGMANSVDPDQTGSSLIGSALFAQAYPSEKFSQLRSCQLDLHTFDVCIAFIQWLLEASNTKLKV